jgi:hypothetical protein
MKYEPTAFGDMAVLPIPDDCDAILVCIDIHQHEPVMVCLPHQLYRDKIRGLFRKHPDARSITVMPYRNADKIEIKRTRGLS